MARRKKGLVQPNKPPEKDDISDAEAGDYCYYLDPNNRINFAKIINIFTEKDILCFSVMCQSDFKFHALPYYFCSFDEKYLKRQKRNILKSQHRTS